MQGVGEPDEEQEAGYPQQHLAVVSALARLRRSWKVGWVITPLISPLQRATEHLCHASSKELLENYHNGRSPSARQGGRKMNQKVNQK